MKYFLWGFLKKLDITHLITFSLGVIVICFLDALVFEKNIADWVSSTANVVMAGAALYAAWNAKDWFKQRSYSLGFAQAEKLLLELDSIFLSMDDIIKKISSYNKNDFLLTTIPEREIFIKLNDKIVENKNNLENIKYNSLSLVRWNIKIDMPDILSQKIYEVNECLSLAQETIRPVVDYHSDKTNYLKYSSFYHISNKKLVKNYEIISHSYKEFQNIPFDDIFSIVHP